jgi:cytochrome b pre-mRNA-processing protein 3
MAVLICWCCICGWCCGDLKPAEGGASVSQALFDRFCDDMDANLREMGVGDLTVPKRMQAFGEAFYGRAAAYDLALSGRRASRWRKRCARIF